MAAPSWRLAPSAVALAVALGAPGCGPVPTTAPERAPPVTGPARPTAAGPGASAPGAEAAAPSARHRIGRAERERLPCELRAEPGETGVLLIGHDELPGRSFVRRIDATGQMGPVRSLDDRPFASFGGTPALLATSDGERVCLERLEDASDASGAEGPWCATASPLAMAPLDGAFALLELEAEPADETAPVDGRPRGPSQAAPDPTEPRPVRLELRRLSIGGATAPSAEDTGLRLRPPLPGMGLVGAVPLERGMAVAWYDHLRTLGRGRGRRAEAELVAARLDERGALVASSRVRLAAGARDYGFIAGHLEPRLVAYDGRAAFVGRTVDDSKRAKRFGYEARALDAARTAEADPVVCRIAPATVARLAAPTATELELLTAIARRGPALAPGQPRAEIEQVAWVGARGYYLAHGELESVDRTTAEVRAEPWPFVAERDRVLAAGLDPDGEGLAHTRSRIAELRSSGLIDERDAPPASGPGTVLGATGEGFPAIGAVRIASSWWALSPREGTGPLGWRLGRVDGGSSATPSEGDEVSALAIDPAAAALVGGAARGLLLTVRFGRDAAAWLEVRSLAPDGGLALLTRSRAPATTDLAAVERATGGAIVIGRAAHAALRWIAFVVDEQGAPGTPTDLGLDPAPTGSALRLEPLPTGGALLAKRDGTEVRWLDEQARPIATSPWPAERARGRCLDGQPGRPWVASPEPGRLVHVAALGRPGTCVVAGPSWARDGSLRWIGTSSSGLDVAAEIGIVPAASPLPGLRPAAPVRPEPPRPALALARPAATEAPCPPDMVYVAARFCIDRYEARLADADSALPLAPDWPATPGLAQAVLGAWTTGRWRSGDVHAQAWPLPPLLRPVDASPVPVARSVRGLRPSGYLTGLVAETACQNAGKRLCRQDEFALACRGQEDRKFPYGADYVSGACNVFRELHPATALHGNAAVGHLDPRLNRVHERGAPLLAPTGATLRCRSRWGDDYVYDLVGNLDEWLAGPKGAFAGGFYARATRAGCDALITAHPRRYLDYSTGTRCCRDAATVPP